MRPLLRLLHYKRKTRNILMFWKYQRRQLVFAGISEARSKFSPGGKTLVCTKYKLWIATRFPLRGNLTLFLSLPQQGNEKSKVNKLRLFNRGFVWKFPPGGKPGLYQVQTLASPKGNLYHKPLICGLDKTLLKTLFLIYKLYFG